MNHSLNADPSRVVVVDSESMPFTPSPGGQVLRKRLHLYGPAESGQVTSIVQYPPGAVFPSHDHPEGEEILVLSGIFSDDAGEWGPGSYLLNPEGFRHAPYSEEGCLIFVKLRQYAGEDRTHVALQTKVMPWREGEKRGVSQKQLYVEEGYPEQSRLEQLEAGVSLERTYPAGAELLVLDGRMYDDRGEYGSGFWLRLPVGHVHRFGSKEGCRYYLKTGGLPTMRWPEV